MHGHGALRQWAQARAAITHGHTVGLTSAWCVIIASSPLAHTMSRLAMLLEHRSASSRDIELARRRCGAHLGRGGEAPHCGDQAAPAGGAGRGEPVGEQRQAVGVVAAAARHFQPRGPRVV